MLASPVADPAQNFLIYRYALLYHDTLYARLERILDETGIENIGGEPVQSFGTVDIPQTQNPDTGPTENAIQALFSLGAEVAMLRQFISTIADPSSAIIFVGNSIRQMTTNYREGVDPSFVRDVYFTTLNAADKSYYRAILPVPTKETPAPSNIAAIQVSLRVIRDIIFKKYTPITTTQVTVVSDDGTQERTASTSTIDAFIDETQSNIPITTTTVSNEMSISGGDELRGGSLQSASDILSNDESSSSSVSSGGRRELYAGLRKRSGSGSPPGVRE
jgi:hypothetical protein